MGKILAIDLGTKRVGLAVSDPLKIIASPLSIIPFTNMDSLVSRLLVILADNSVEKTIIGLPIREDGTEGAGCIASKKLEDKLRENGIDTVLWDERYSSSRDSKDKLDSLSACVLLDSYLKSLEH
jgi:putative Holliday junction resolvase